MTAHNRFATMPTTELHREIASLEDQATDLAHRCDNLTLELQAAYNEIDSRAERPVTVDRFTFGARKASWEETLEAVHGADVEGVSRR